MSYFPNKTDIQKAAEILEGVSAVTPLMENRRYSNLYNCKVFFKREDLQPVRSYKIRGAYHKMYTLSDEERAMGVVCASAGNHAQGVAFACQLMEVSGTIYMPVTTPGQKIEQVRMFGDRFVEIRLVGDTFDDANQEALNYAETTGGTYIHPFDDEKVIEGQGTIGLELLDQLNAPLDYLFVPVGGGGLAAGVGSLMKEFSPKTRIIGVEPDGAPSLQTSLREGKNITLDTIDKFVDGASVKRVGDRNFRICQKVIDEVVTVDEGLICETILDLYNRDAIVVEPAGGLSIAGLSKFQHELQGKNVVCVVSGSNNDITRMEEIKERAMIYKGRKHYFVVKFPQRAGALKEFVMDVLDDSDDITYFQYTKKNARDTGGAVIGIEIPTCERLDPLMDSMKEKGFYERYLNEENHLMDLIV